MPKIIGILLAPPLLRLFLTGLSAGVSWAGLLPRSNPTIRGEELSAKQAPLPQG